MALPLAGLRSVRGQPQALDFLRRSRARGRLGSAYLFEGPEGVGKERTARALCQGAVCEKPLEGDACGECPSCRQVAQGLFVDLVLVARELDVVSQKPLKADDVSEELKVDTIRDLQRERLLYRPSRSRWVLLRDADRLNQAAGNALLKTLEEPPADTHLVLLTAQPSKLLPTLRSRCQRVRFAPLPTEVLRELVLEHGVDATVAEQALPFADGSMSRALALCEGGTLASRREWVHKMLEALRTGRAAPLVGVAGELKALGAKDDAEVDAVLELLERHFRDDALAHAESTPKRAVVSAARAGVVRRAAATRAMNANLQLLLEQMLVHLREARG